MKAEKKSVTMDDGRVVGFGPTQKVRKETLMAAGRPVGIRFDGSDGQTFTAHFADLPDAEWLSLAEPDGISLWAAAHGYTQKLGDEYASLDTVTECMDAVRALWTRLCAGAWDSETRGFGASGVLLDAVLLAFPHMGREEARKILGDMKPGERTALQVSEQVKPHFDRLQAERTKGADIGALTAKFQKAE